jgi:hypothetical protein
MAETKPGPWTRLLKAAREAQDLVAAEHHDQTGGGWDSDDAMQVYEDIGCAALDVEESGVDADAAPDLLAACEQVLRGWGHQDGVSRAVELARAAVAKAKGG